MKNKYFDNYDEYLKLQVSKVGSRDQYSLLDQAESVRKEHYQGTRVGKPRWAAALAELVPPADDINALVIGARWGSDVLFLREAGYSSIAAFDLYDPPLSGQVETGDAHCLAEFVDPPIHVIWAHHVFEHFFKPSKVMEELQKVVAPNACMYVGIPFAPRNKYDAQDEFSTPEEFCDLMKGFDFHVAQFHENKRGKNKTKIYHFYIFRRAQ